MSKLQLVLLGNFDCLLPSGERISLSMRKAEVLLAYLALAPGIRHPRERLLNLLWSDRSEEQARNSLRQCLSTIKKSLGDAADLVIKVDRTTVCLTLDRVDVDAIEFEHLAADSGLDVLSNAAKLYGGEFLEGISIRDAACQDWLEAERGRFKRQYIEILTNLSHTLLASRDFGASIKIAEKLVSEDSLGESGWRLLMRSYADNGDRSHALQAFKRCQQALRAELDVEPEAETLGLRDQIATSQTKPAPGPAGGSAAQDIAAELPRASTNEKTSVNESPTSDHRIAVLPFDNLSGDPEQEYFSDGITDSIILNLSMFPDLQVKSRNSSFAFKQQIKSLGEISQELNVDYVVEGSIRKSRDRVRITVQLIEAVNGNQIWGKRYDADIENLFDLEEELSRSIAATVTGQIESDLQRIALAKSAADQQSYDLLLAGKYHSYRFNRTDTVIAIEKLNQCLQQDPDNIRAHALLYTCHGMDFLERWTRDYQASFELAGTHVRRALELGPDLSEVQAAYAEYLIFAEQPEQASKHLDKALKINPNDTVALSTRALCLIVQGDFAAALKVAEHTCRLDPYHPWAEWELAGSQYLSGLYETALETMGNFRTDPGFTQIFAIACLIKLNKTESARQALQVLLRDCREEMLSMPQNIDEWTLYIRSCYPFTNRQHNQDLIDCLVTAGLDEVVEMSSTTPSKHEHSIAVLPFDNLSGDPGQEYFSDGISESIILHLNLFPGLIVKSRNSSFAFKQQIKGLGEISAELGVDYLVEGSVRRSAEQIRITVQLVEAASGNQVWGKRYDAPLIDLFSLEEDLSRSIAATVTGQIESDLQRIALTKGAAEQQAYDLLLAGHYHLARFTPQDNAIAIEKFNLCLEQDPDSVRAHALLCGAHGMDRLERWSSDYQLSSKRAQEHIDRAMELDPGLSMVQTFYAELLTFNGKFALADKHLDKALAINPNDPEVFAVNAAKYISKGDFAAAIENATHAFELDPYHPWAEWELTAAQYFSESYEAALETIAGARTSPGFETIFAIAANIKLGRSDTARQILQDFLWQCRETMRSMPRNLEEWYDYTRCYYLCADSRYNQDLVDCLVQAGLEEFLDSPAQPLAESSHNIAVLPFDNLSGDPEQEYFSDGISESIILHLNLFPGLSVKSRNSSFAFKQQIKGLGEISKELGVDYIVEGSLRKSADKIRITVQLIEAASGNQVWGKRYDAPLADLFSLEEELSRSIAATVTGQIDSDLQRIALAKGAAGSESYDLLLCGIYHYRRFTRQDTAIAIDKLNQCLVQDPDNVRAHAGLYVCHLMSYLDRWTEDFRASFDLAAKHIRKALELAPESGLVQGYFGMYRALCGEYDSAAKHLGKALEINPNDPTVLASMALSLEIQGRAKADEALQAAEQAFQLDPYHPWAQWEIAVSWYLKGDYETVVQTISNLRNSIGFVHVFGIAANIKLGRIDPARQALQALLEDCRESMLSMPQTLDEWLQYTRDNYPFADPQINQDIIDCLVQAGLEGELSGRLNKANNVELPSILVLPFKNISGDPEQEYFSDGISESIISSLGAYSGPRVKSRHTSFAFKNSSRSLDEVAAELEVNYIVEGSIRKSADRVRINVQLVESASGDQLWTKRFDADLNDLFSVEDELTNTIAATISGRIGKEIKNLSLQKPMQNLQSYDYLMRGLYHMEKFTAEDVRIGREQLLKSIEHDPQNAEATAILASSHIIDLYENWSADRDESKRLMKFYGQRALEIDADNAMAHTLIAEQLVFARDYQLAETHVERAIEINPTLADGYSVKAALMSCIRRYDEAHENAELAMQLDPYHPYSGWDAGEVFRTTGQFERAIKAFRSVPYSSPSLRAQTAAALVGLGKIDEARAEMKAYLELARAQMPRYPNNESEWRELWSECVAYQFKEDSETLFDQLLQAGLCDDLQDQPDNHPSIAVLPFKNMSDDPEQEYFSDGITISLILSLGMFDGLTARSQNSSFAYKNSTVPSQVIANELKVDFLIEGSIRKSGSKLRLSVQLVESESNSQIWGKQYDAELEDILDLEQELSQTLAATISGRIGQTLQQSAIRKPARNLRSYDYLLRALFHLGKLTARDLELARQMIEKCLEIDPENSLAHTNLGMINNIELIENWVTNHQLALDSAQHHLARALELDPENATAHAYMAEFLFNIREYAQSEFHADQAIELNPTASEGYAVKADLLGFTRRVEQAVPYADKCIRLDPYSVGAGWVAGAIYRKAGFFQKAIKTFRAIAHPPASVHGLIAVCFINLELPEEAHREMLLYKKLARQEMPFYPRSNAEWRALWSKNLPYQHEEDFDEFFEQLLTAGLFDKDTESIEEIPSIAVLPFENMSGDPEQAFFSDGITADIISTLSKFKHLRIVARHSTEIYRNHKEPIAKIAQQQQVRYILEGSVRKSGKRIRVSAELIDSLTEQNCWSERYDRDLDDLFAVQDEIMQKITLAMKVHLDDGDMASQRSVGTNNIKAWELIITAVDLQDTYIRQNILEARAMAKQALALDPDYVFAWVTLAWTHWQEVYSGWSKSYQKSLTEAEKASHHALAIDPDNANALCQAGTGYIMRHDADKALEYSRRAVELEPGNAENQALRAFALVFVGDYEQARLHFQNVHKLCPVMPNWYYLIDAQLEQYDGDLDRAIAIYQQGLAVEPDAPLCRFYLVNALMQKGDAAGAQQYADEIRALDSSVNGNGLVRALSQDARLRDEFHANLEAFSLV